MRGSDFAGRATRYDELRPADETWWELFDVLVDEGDLRGRRVLEVGCGTGLLAAALEERASARVWAVDREPAMAEIARTRVRGVKVGSAEALPFKDSWFERAVLRQVIQHLDRPRALPELRRVLASGGRAVIATFDDSHFRSWWLSEFFPEICEIDAERFPSPAVLRTELDAAGFHGARVRRVTQRRTIGRETALERIRGRHISTFDLLDEETLAAGTERAERELPDSVEVTLEWAIVVACT